ncbi:mitochondrial amidoxime-reducing component 1-like [Mya arenaria]|uniref:mitochondrial amidoxime-reducing component 1-like n=1 Tax=Mya arenaria TaxID=6604 RepID=UPI0022E27C1F|nr:mitochondrial amidoxime-reducing component 1-like [Mya arenaria]XP_052767174.1 mitochondrial amidoxime-reducing component 1-like [Mya arenaria]XP_052767175.1 mitochondrial amidoxime-reducing component 1-like [Mya arenaria]
MFDNLDPRLKILLGVAGSLSAKYVIGALMKQKRDDRFELVGHVDQLICYPVKSCPGISVQEAYCSEFGLRVDWVTDRHYMITRPNGRFLSQRQEPSMALISVSITPKGVELRAPDTRPLLLPKLTSKQGQNVISVNIWEVERDAVDCGEAAAQWVSSYLGTVGYRVVCYTHDLPKSYYMTFPKPWTTRALETDATGFADWATYLVATSESINAVNKQLKGKPVTVRTFRPNILIAGTDPWEEDTWEEVIIGADVRMRCLDACARCTLTTVDPEKGERRADGEPLKTLKRIRSIPPYNKYDECVFGVNTAPDICGIVKVGDPVYAIKTTSL